MKKPRNALMPRAAIVFVAIFALACAPVVPATAETPKRTPGQVFKNCPTCPELVVVPAGIYIMGVGGKRKIEKPAHRVNVAKPFAMGRFEITFAE